MAANDRNALLVLIAAFTLFSLSFGARISFGVFMPVMTVETGFAIASISTVMAIQNLMWGAAQPFVGRVADRYGAAPVAFFGALLYGGGLAISGIATDILVFGMSAGLIIGVAQAALGLPVLLGAIGRTVSEKRRGLFLGIGTAGGSFGQLVFSPLSEWFMTDLGLVDSFLLIAALCCAAASLALLLRRERRPTPEERAAANMPGESVGAVLSRALKDRSFLYLTAGFFVCGFHVAFIGVHLPNFAAVCGLPTSVGTTGLAIIGGFNIIGTILAGQIGSRFRPKIPLALIYLLRGVVTFSLLFIPITESVLLIFSALMGLLWLSTVPLTNLIVAKLHGAANVGMLFGIVFFSHQVGSFVGLIMAGEFLAIYGDYDAMWIASTILGLFAAAIHLPIEDTRKLQPA